MLDVGLALESGLAHGIQDKLVLEERLHERPEGSMKTPSSAHNKIVSWGGRGRKGMKENDLPAALPVHGPPRSSRAECSDTWAL